MFAGRIVIFGTLRRAIAVQDHLGLRHDEVLLVQCDTDGWFIDEDVSLVERGDWLLDLTGWVRSVMDRGEESVAFDVWRRSRLESLARLLRRGDVAWHPLLDGWELCKKS